MRRCADGAIRFAIAPYEASLRHADVDLAVAHSDLDRREPHARIARMAAGLQIELEAVPRTHEVARLGEAQAGALHVGGERFLDLVENLPLADRPAGMRAHVLVGEDLVAEAEYPDFDVVDGEDPIVPVLELAQRRDRDIAHCLPL